MTSRTGPGEIDITEDRASQSERGGRGTSASGDSRDGRSEHGGRGAECEQWLQGRKARTRFGENNHQRT